MDEPLLDTCPTCGSRVGVWGSPEGTSGYTPAQDVPRFSAEERAALDWARVTLLEAKDSPSRTVREIVAAHLVTLHMMLEGVTEQDIHDTRPERL